jgi:hypothetical protein
MCKSASAFGRRALLLKIAHMEFQSTAAAYQYEAHTCLTDKPECRFLGQRCVIRWVDNDSPISLIAAASAPDACLVEQASRPPL